MLSALAIILLLASHPAAAQEDPFGAAIRAAREFAQTTRDAIRAAAPYQVASTETAKLDAFDEDDDFRSALLADGGRYFIDTDLGGILMVVEKDYLDSAGLRRMALDLIEAVREVPKVTGRPPLIKKRFTVYLYGKGPISQANVPGAQPGEKGLMLKLAKEGQSPTFHEMTHLLAGASDSQSLAEGMACLVQENIRPGKANGFMRDGVKADEKAKAALENRPARFAATIGAPGRFKFSTPEVRQDFYYASWSFVDFLHRKGGMKKLWEVIDAGGTPESYQKAFELSYDELISAWKSAIDAP